MGKEYYYLNDDSVFKIFFKRAVNMLKRLIAMSLRIREKDVTDIKFKDPTISNDFKESKNSILDLLVEINHSKIINVEMQNSDNKNTTERFTWHLCNKYTENLGKGEDYSKLKEVHGIYLLNYNDKNYPNFFSKYESRDIMNAKTTTDSLINMSVFNLNKIKDIDKYNFSEEEKDLIRLIKCEDKEELREMAKKSYELQEAIRILDEINADKELRDAIYYERRREHDEAQARSDRDEAIKEMHEAIEQRDSAFSERDSAINKLDAAINERNKAFEQRDNAIIGVAKELLSLNIKPEDISKATGLSIDKITSFI